MANGAPLPEGSWAVARAWSKDGPLSAGLWLGSRPVCGVHLERSHPLLLSVSPKRERWVTLCHLVCNGWDFPTTVLTIDGSFVPHRGRRICKAGGKRCLASRNQVRSGSRSTRGITLFPVVLWRSLHCLSATFAVLGVVNVGERCRLR